MEGLGLGHDVDAELAGPAAEFCVSALGRLMAQVRAWVAWSRLTAISTRCEISGISPTVV
ncbi:hypothetical protein A4E84_00050 [Streptomyces qaidamensis]|uniref:Uncharacterized protein n=1 Tax=Streptomyces qaidamensis TaxID=1783515 RepID=A0A143BSA7_9ACTN|nr:hypothetical protein A4E84_00050 [Streptomyces qaidamensis]